MLAGVGGAAIATAYVYGAGIGPQVAFSPVTQITLSSSFFFAEGVAVDGRSNVYVADTNHNAVKEIPSDCAYDRCVHTVGGFVNGPYGAAVDGAGNVYVASPLSHLVEKIPPGCNSVLCMTGVNGFTSPDSVAVDGRGNVYVGDSYAVKEIPSGCASFSCVTTRTEGLGSSGDVAVNGRGNIYVDDFSNNAIKEFPLGCTSGSRARTLGGGFNGPTAVAVDGGGDVYVADFSNNAVKQVPPGCTSATCVITLTQSVNAQPAALAVDGSGNIYVVDWYNSRVLKEDVVRSPFVTFANTPAYSTSADSPKTVTLQNIGTAPLRFLVPALGMNPSVPANFSLDDSSTCPQLDISSHPSALPSGRSCTLLWSFTLTIVGGQPTEMATITDNNLNALRSIQTIDLNGTATQAAQTITFRPIPPLAAGSSVSLVATASSGLPVSFHSLTPSVCTVSSRRATAIAAGTCTIQATQAGNDAYAPATPVSRSFLVTQAEHRR